ncbi:MAG: glycosyltransferase family 4 protein [Bacteroidetes bacterium]|nr:glycosyltransferase family 4 protein [Bacteroidota bacterium]
MHIVVNTRLLIKNKLEGIGWFTYQTLKLITQTHQRVKFTFLFDRPFDEEFLFSSNVTGVVLGPKARHPFLYYFWLQFKVKPYLEKTKPDLFLSPDGFLCLNTQIKQLPVIHDINFFHFPKHIKYLTEKYYNYFFPKFAKQAKRIATVSNYSKVDISKTYKIDLSLIDVVYNGINSFFKPLNEIDKDKIKKVYSNSNPYFVYVGAISPRKNISNLMIAFNTFKKNNPNLNHNLLIAGAVAWGNKEVQQNLNKLEFKNQIIFTGRLSNTDLANILSSAEALVYIPLFEGFGIPLIEAMECEVPVICSNVTSLPEVAGNAAVLVNPLNVNDISDAMCKIVNEPNLKQSLINNGNIQKLKFSWEKSAKLLWESVEKTLHN